MQPVRVGPAGQPPPSGAQTDDSAPETQAVLSRLEAILWLTATAIVVGPVRAVGPSFGLDPGWAAGLNLGHQTGLRFGRDLIFTFGPWGFLDVPHAISRFDFVLGSAFSVVSVAAAWLLTLGMLRCQLKPKVALLATSLLTIILSGVSSPSFLLAVVASVACVRHLRQISTLSTAWCPVAVAGLSALLVQVKFPEGAVVTVFAFASSIASPRNRLMRTGISCLVWPATFLVLWLLAGQSISDIGPWQRASTEFVMGYASAMSLELFADAVSYLWYAVALLIMVSVLSVRWRRWQGRSRASYLGAIAVTTGLMLFGFKQTFTRHSLEHNAAFFVIAVLLLCALLERGPKWRPTVLLIAVSTLMAGVPFSTYVRANPVDAWASSWRILSSDESQSALIDQARADDQAAYELPTALVRTTQGHAVSVDPWEVSMVWAYSMKWRPMPVFQSYSAYTPYLDQLNAEAARRAGDDQMIIRTATVSTKARQTLIDSRNPMWESPRYTLTVVCNYSMVMANHRWMLLRKSANRCGEPSPITATQRVSAGESVKVPNASSDEIVIASFVPTTPGPLASLARLAFKDLEPLMASLDGKPFRLPEGLASGPLLTNLPTAVDWPVEFKGHTSTRSISFSRPGTVQFRTIQLMR